MTEKLAEVPGAAHSPTADGCRERVAANPPFLRDRLCCESKDLQGLPELTIDGLAAIAARGVDRRGRVAWDLDCGNFDASAPAKLFVGGRASA